MKRSSWLRVLTAAFLVIVGGVLIAQAETHSMKIKVTKGEGQTVAIDQNGTAEVITLEDLADGESRDFVSDKHTITVRRDGDQLNILMDGEKFGNMKAGDAHANMVWVAKTGEGEETVDIIGHGEMTGSKIIMFAGEGDEGDHRVIKVHCKGDDDCEDLETINIDIEKLHGEHGGENIFIEEHNEIHGGHPIMLHAVGASADHVVFKCTEDDTVLKIAKEQATQESYVCPVCGRAMERSEEIEVKVMSFVHETKDAVE